MNRNARVWIVIGLVALVPRLAYLTQYVSTPYYGTVFLDEQYHYEWAQRIASGHLIGEDAFFRAPLYSYLLGGLFSLTGPSQYLPRILQLCLGAFASVLVFALTDKMFGRRAALIAWLFAAFYGPSIFHEAELVDVVLQLALYPAILLAAISAIEKPRARRALLTGFLTGLSALARPNILLFVPFLIVILGWALRRQASPRRLGAMLASFAAALALCVLPATIHNAIAGKCFVPIATYGGINFYLGNNPNADGHTPRTRRHYYSFDRYRDSVELFAQREAQAINARAMNAAEISRYWTGEGLRFMADQPGAWARLTLKKFAFFWNDLEIKNNKDLEFAAERIPVLYALTRLGRWGVLAPLGLLGLAMALARRRRADTALAASFLAVFMLSVVLFFVSGRHRLPAVPLLAVFAGYGVDRAIEAFAEERRRRLVAIAGAFAVLACLMLPHWFDLRPQWIGRDWWTWANCIKDRALSLDSPKERMAGLSEAKEAYYCAASFAPEDPDIWNNLGEVFYQQDQYKSAAECFRKACRLDRDYVRAWSNLGVCLENLGALDEAARILETAVQIAPDYALASQNLGDVRLKQKRWAEALQAFDRALVLWPESPLAHLGRAQALGELGKKDEAARALQRAIELGGEPIRVRAAAK